MLNHKLNKDRMLMKFIFVACYLIHSYCKGFLRKIFKLHPKTFDTGDPELRMCSDRDGRRLNCRRLRVHLVDVVLPRLVVPVSSLDFLCLVLRLLHDWLS